jgi:amino acid transporter
MIVSLLVLANATLLDCPRVLYIMAEDGAEFRQLTRVNAGGTPTVGPWATRPLTKSFGIFGRPVPDFHAMEARSQLRHRPTWLKGEIFPS